MTHFPASTETKRISHPTGLWAILGKGNQARWPRRGDALGSQSNPRAALPAPWQLSSDWLPIPPLLQVPACSLDIRGICHNPCSGSQTLKHQRTKPHQEGLEQIVSSLSRAQTTSLTHPPGRDGTHTCDTISNAPASEAVPTLGEAVSAGSSGWMPFLLLLPALLGPP